MPCDWKNRVCELLNQVTQPMREAWSGQRMHATVPVSNLRGQRFNPVNSPPAWLSRRAKIPAQRGGPRT